VCYAPGDPGWEMRSGNGGYKSRVERDQFSLASKDKEREENARKAVYGEQSEIES
jgi:hypothetical protein